MPDLTLRLNKDMLTVAPLLTLSLLDASFGGEECLEYFNILDADLVRETHRRFRVAGAECAPSNTLGAHRSALASFGLEDALVDINRAGVQRAREAGFEHVLAAVRISPADELEEQVEALLQEEPDALWLVGQADDPLCDLAIETVHALTDLPIMAPDSIDSERRQTAIGYSMGLGLTDTRELLQQRIRASTPESQAAPFMVCPDPGAPVGNNQRQLSASLGRLADTMIDFALEARALGVQFIGTAPGTSPVFTGAISAAISGMDVAG